MLDSKEMARRIKAALRDAQPPVSGSALAKACDVTPQAVSGWIKNGRIAKKHIQKVAELTHKPLEYFLGNGDGARKIPIPFSEDQVQDFTNFKTVLQAWQSTDVNGRGNILAIAKAVGVVNGLKRKRGGSR